MKYQKCRNSSVLTIRYLFQKVFFPPLSSFFWLVLQILKLTKFYYYKQTKSNQSIKVLVTKVILSEMQFNVLKFIMSQELHAIGLLFSGENSGSEVRDPFHETCIKHQTSKKLKYAMVQKRRMFVSCKIAFPPLCFQILPIKLQKLFHVQIEITRSRWSRIFEVMYYKATYTYILPNLREINSSETKYLRFHGKIS